MITNPGPQGVVGPVGSTSGSSGTFTGDGTNNRAIAHGLGTIPKEVIIQRLSTVAILGVNIGTAVMTVVSGAGTFAVIIPLDAANFYLGASGEMNTNLGLFAWMAR